MEDQKELVKLKSEDGVIVELSRKAAMRSELIKTTMENYPDFDVLDVKKVNGDSLSKIKEYLEHYESIEPKEIKKPLAENFKDCVDEWDYGFIGNEENIETLMNLIKAASFMNIDPLINLLSAKIAHKIKGISTATIRNTFGIKKLSEEEDKLLDKRNGLIMDVKDNEQLVKEKNSKYQTLKKEYSELTKKKYIISDNFPTYKQSPNYPNGCEPVALYLVLEYYNVNVTMEEIVNRLDKGKAPYKLDGKIYGGDPEKEFVGDPRLTKGGGYGVYQKPIISLANNYKKGIKDISGTSLDNVLKIVNKGKPVQVWATVDMTKPRSCITWTTDTNKKVTWQCGFHSMVIIGFTHNTVIVSDPTRGDIRSYNKTTFETRYNQIGKRAIYYEK